MSKRIPYIPNPSSRPNIIISDDIFKWFFLLAGITGVILTIVFTIDYSTYKPWVSPEKKVDNLQKASIPQQIIDQAGVCTSSEIKPEECKIIPVTSRMSKKIIISSVTTIDGKWGGRNATILTSVSNISIESTKKKNWNNTIEFDELEPSDVIVELHTSDIPDSFLHNQYTADITMNVDYPSFADGFHYKNKTQKINKSLNLYIVTPEEYKYIDGIGVTMLDFIIIELILIGFTTGMFYGYLKLRKRTR